MADMEMDRKDIISNILDKANPKLSRHLGIDNAFSRLLVAEAVITSEQRDEIYIIKVKGKKVDMLLENIKDRESSAYDRFVSLLGTDSNTKVLHDYMKKLEAEAGLSK